MHKDFHIPTPQFDPTESDCKWVIENIAPHLYPALQIIKGSFDRVDLQQSLFDKWPQRHAVEEHFKNLGLSIRRFAAFISKTNPNPVVPHIDAFVRGTPMVARFNIVYQGRSPMTLSWWNKDINSGMIEERKFTELRHGVEKTAYSYKATTDVWPAPDYIAVDPGAGWNRTELAHRADGPDCNQHRIIITVEVAEPIPWEELVNRLQALS